MKDVHWRSVCFIIVIIKVIVNVPFTYLILYKNFFTHDGDIVMQNIAKAKRLADKS